MKSKKVLILFSGGLDSTYLMWKNLEEGNTVYPIYVNIGNNINKTKIELQQCEILIEKFQKAYPGKCFRHKTTLDLTVYGNCNEVSLLQMPIWITGIIYSNLLLEVDEVQIGYVMNDDAISYLDEIKKLYYSFKPLLNLENKQMPKLLFPLIKEKKWFMYDKLPYEYNSLTFSCENVKIISEGEKYEFRLCGDCSPCKRQKAENIFNHSKQYNREEIDYNEEPMIDYNEGHDYNEEPMRKYPTKLIAHSAKVPIKKSRKLPAKKKL